MALSRVSPEEAARLLREGYVYIDVRSPEEFALGHPEGAFNVPWLDPDSPQTPNPRFLPVMGCAFERAQGLVVGCESGVRSVAAAQALSGAGYARVVEQRAGFGGRRDAFGGCVEPGWERAGLPVSYDPTPGRDYRALSDGCEEGDSSPDSER